MLYRGVRRHFRLVLLMVSTLLVGAVAVRASLGASVAHGASTPVPQSVAGVLDLTSWNFHQGNVTLAGEWEFYWGELIDPSEFQRAEFDRKALHLTVPGSWQGVMADGVPLPGEGFGTYRLRVIVGENVGLLNLHLADIRTAHRLWINGQLMSEMGVVGQDPAQTRPITGPRTLGIAPGQPILDIVLHVSNFAFRAGGIGKSLVLGEDVKVIRAVQRSLAFEMLLIASLLVIGVYHFGIWIIRPQDRHTLFFSIFCLIVAPRTSALDQAPLLLLFPNLSWELLLKIEYIGFYLGLPAFMFFLHYLYPKEFVPRLLYPFVTICAMFAFAVLVTPGRINSHLMPYFEWVAVASFGFSTFGLIQAARRDREGAKLILIGALIVFFTVIHDMLFFKNVLGNRALAPLAILGVITAYSLVLSKRFSDEFEKQRILTEENAALVQTVRKQVEEIKDSRRLMHERDEHTRRHVAEMLHGTVQSRLLFARHHLHRVLRLLPQEDDVQSKRFSQVQRMIHQAVDQIELARNKDVREISHLLHPMLIRFGLGPAVGMLADHYREHFEVQLVIGEHLSALEAAEGGDSINESIRLDAYRIVEEALTNVLKHADATFVTIDLDVTAEHVLVIRIKDNGRGMNLRGRSHGLGFMMITARAEELHGRLQVHSAPGEGLEIVVELPLAPSQEEEALG